MKDILNRKKICYICKHRRGCIDKEDMGYTGCCGFRDFKIVEIIKNIFGWEEQ